MKKFFLLSVMVLTVFVGAIAGIDEKLSSSTQLFIAERDGKISLDLEVDGPRAFSRPPLKRTKPVERMIAPAELVNGEMMVSAFIHINPNQAYKLESAFGVVIQETFNEFVIAMIPVDKIERVAEVSEVKQVNVARKVSTRTNNARSYTNTDDVINFSNDAITAGLPQAFKGTGVVVGVIDDGIDFQHMMFRDSNGNYRIKRAYIARGSGSFNSYTNITSSSPTTDDSSESHGTHTSSTAGGSNITVGNTTYGGMAPEAQLVLVGCGSYLYNTNIAMGIKYICDYADSQNMPAVVSISLGTQFGPHDGTGELASTYAQYAGSNPNHIIVYAAGNEAGGDFGSVHVEGNASSQTPMTTVLNGAYYAMYYGSSSYLNRVYQGYDVFYARTPNVRLNCKLHVVNTSTNEVVWTSSAITSSTSSVSGITTYFGRSPSVSITQDSYSRKYYIQLYFNSMSKNSSYNDARYALAVSVYPASGSTWVDGWDVNGYNAFGTKTGTFGGYTFVAGNDNSSIGDEPGSNDIISVGAYCSKRSVTDYRGTPHNLTYYTLGDIAYFSSYQTEGHGPTGVAKPDICAPGATIVAGINHYDNTMMSNGLADYGYYLIYNSTNSSLGSLDGTSMATPCAAGIIGLYLQAAKYAGKTLNTEGIRDVFAHSAINDNYTNKANFGRYGKIDALEGIKYILGSTPIPDPVLTVNPTSLTFTANVGQTTTKTFTVTGTDLVGNVNLSVSGGNGAYSISPSTLTAAQAMAGATVTVTYAPTSAGTTAATVTATSSGADNATVSLSGTATAVPTINVNPTSLSFNTVVGTPVTKTFTVQGSALTNAVYLTVNGNGFSIDKANITRNAANNGPVTVTVTYNPNAGGNHTGTVTITSTGAETKTVTLNGTATEPERTITASTNSISMSATTGETVTRTFTINGQNLNGNVNLTVNGGGGVFSVSPTTLTAAQVMAGATITVTYAPTAAGNHNATITISGGGANPVTVNLTGTATDPVRTITASTNSISMNAITGETVTTTFTITGQNLNSNVSLTVSGNTVFSVSPTTLTAAQVMAGATITVTYAPTVAGNQTGTITINGGGASPVTVSLSGTSTNPVRTLTASTDVINMSALTGETVTRTFTVSGVNLNSNVNLNLNDANGVYSITPTTLTAAQAMAGATITVTYAPTTFGNHTSSIVISGGGANPVTVNLNGTANIAKFAPVMLEPNDAYVTLTGFRAEWTDETPQYNVSSYTLEVNKKVETPEVVEVATGDFSALSAQVNAQDQLTNQVNNASSYLPAGWSATVGMWVNAGCIISGELTQGATSYVCTLSSAQYDLTGYDKLTVVMNASTFNSNYGTSVVLRVSTSAGSQEITLNSTNYNTYTVVLDCASTDAVTLTGVNGMYCLRDITIYAGDLNAAQAGAKAAESGDDTYRLITGITPDKFYDVANLEAGGTYSYHVKAIYIDGTESEWSNLEWVTLLQGHGYTVGDVNHDGVLTIKDVTMLINALTTGDDTICQICSDVNGNGVINIADVSALIELLLNSPTRSIKGLLPHGDLVVNEALRLKL